MRSELVKAAGVVLGVMLIVADQRRQQHTECHQQIHQYLVCAKLSPGGFPSFLAT
jgi:hypothetical protein